MSQYCNMTSVKKLFTDIGASKLIVAVGTSDINITGVDVGAHLTKISLSGLIPPNFQILTSGLEQTMVPTLGSYLPEVTPLKFLK